MSGYVDLHVHLLPGVDDGARTMDDALAMAKTLVSLGFTAAAPSPHNRPEYQPREVCDARRLEVAQALGQEGVALTLDTNAENFFLDEGLLATAATPDGRRMGAAGKYLLVEAPYTSPLPMLREMIFRIKLKGVTPVIAHPERCLEFERPGSAAAAVASGALLQLDIAAVTGRYGGTAKKLAHQFLDEGLYAIAASDMHSPVGAKEWLDKAMRELDKRVGTVAFADLLAKNPARILKGEPF